MWSVVFLLVCGVAASVAGPSRLQLAQKWQSFKLSHNKNYQDPGSEALRQSIFLENAVHIEEHNELFEQGKVSFKLELNKFADMRPEEMQARKGLKRMAAGTRRNGTMFASLRGLQLPKSVDWRKQGAVTPIKDQKDCGSCYTFSAVGSLEGCIARKTGKLHILSEQNVLDCSGEQYYNAGCDGGLMDTSLRFIGDQGGINFESEYPYTARVGSCKYRRTRGQPTLSDVGVVESGNERQLMEAVATHGPIAVAVDTKPRTFYMYKSGVYNEPKCLNKPEDADHAVLLIGYGTSSKGEDYWLIKNSWGSTWGEQGCIRIARNKGDMCGVASDACYPIV